MRKKITDRSQIPFNCPTFRDDVFSATNINGYDSQMICPSIGKTCVICSDYMLNGITCAAHIPVDCPNDCPVADDCRAYVFRCSVYHGGHR